MIILFMYHIYAASTGKTDDNLSFPGQFTSCNISYLQISKTIKENKKEKKKRCPISSLSLKFVISFFLFYKIYLLSKFLRRSLMIFIIEGFSDYCLHLHCYYHNVSADMSSDLLQVFVVLGNLHIQS